MRGNVALICKITEDMSTYTKSPGMGTNKLCSYSYKLLQYELILLYVAKEIRLKRSVEERLLRFKSSHSLFLVNSLLHDVASE